MRKLFGFFMIAVIVMLAPLCAGAGSLYDQNLAMPNGVYYGGGNFNGGWTVTNDQGIEVGLRAKLRFPTTTDGVIHSGDGSYYVPVGIDTGHGAAKAMWNYDWSISFTDFVGFSLPDITASLTITDMLNGNSDTVDPLSYWKDNVGWGYPGPAIVTSLQGLEGMALKGIVPSTFVLYGAQNSQNPNFASFPLSPFNALEEGRQYKFDLSVTNGGLTTTDTMFVSTGTPEPASLFLLGGGLFVVGIYRRRRKTA